MTTLTPELIAINERIKTFDKKRQSKLGVTPKRQQKPEIKLETSVNQHGALVGDILCGIWGYEQTNYDFYKVIKVTKQTVTLEKISGYDAGKIYKNKRTSCYYSDGREYSVRISSYSSASCYIADRYAESKLKDAEESANDPYNMH